MTAAQFNFREMPLQKKLIVVNASLFLIVLVVSLLMVLDHREVPESPNMEALEGYIIEQAGTADIAAKEELYDSFGKVGVFQTLILRPTPSPTPVPTPKPDPSLEAAIETWKVVGISKGVAFMEDKRTHEEWLMDIMDPEQRTKVNTFQGVNIEVKLESMDEIYLNAVFTYQGPQGLQSVTKSVFDE